jgi:protein SCO1/2
VPDRRTAAAALLAVLALLPLAGCGSRPADEGPVANVTMHDDDGLNGVVLPTPYRVPDVRLDRASGGRYDLRTDANDPLTLVFFGYTNCPDICQVVMANIASSLTRLDPADRAKVAMVFVTTDPARDTGPVLRSYLSRFDRSFDGLTGDLASIVRVGRAFDVQIAKGRRLPSGGYDVEHGTQVVGVLPDGRAPFVWTEGTDPAALTADIRTILDDKVPDL